MVEPVQNKFKVQVLTPTGWIDAELEMGTNDSQEVGLMITLRDGTGLSIALPPQSGKGLAVALIHHFGVEALRDWRPQ